MAAATPVSRYSGSNYNNKSSISAAAAPASPGSQPAIVIDPAVKETMYSLIEAQRHSHELVVTQLMVSIEESHREARFLRQQLNTSNEMLQDSQLQLRRAVGDKDVLLQKLTEKEAEAKALRQQNDDLRQRVTDDMRELAEVREMVKHAMEETYRSRAVVGSHLRQSEADSRSASGNNNLAYPGDASFGAQQQGQNQQQFSPSRQIINMPATAFSLPSTNATKVPASHHGMKAGISYAAVSPPRARGDKGTESGELLVRRGADDPLQFAINRNSSGALTIAAGEAAARPASAPANNNINNSSHSNSILPQAAVPRSMIQYGSSSASSSQQQSATGGGATNERNDADSTSVGVSFRPITVDMALSRAISVSPQGHVCISVGDESAHALCIYRDLRTVGPMHFEASFRSSDIRSVLVGIAVLAVDGGSGNSPGSSAISASSGLGARCALRGDGTMILATEDGNVFEARSGLEVIRRSERDNNGNSSRSGQGVVTVRLDEMTGRVMFSVGGNMAGAAAQAVPMQIPRSISGVQTGLLVPFVSLPSQHDEVVVRAPLR